MPTECMDVRMHSTCLFNVASYPSTTAQFLLAYMVKDVEGTVISSILATRFVHPTKIYNIIIVMLLNPPLLMY